RVRTSGSACRCAARATGPFWRRWRMAREALHKPMAARCGFPRVIALVGAAVLLTGCANGSWLGGMTDPAPDERDFSAGVALDMQGLNLYLEMMRDLVEGDPVTQAITFRD